MLVKYLEILTITNLLWWEHGVCVLYEKSGEKLRHSLTVLHLLDILDSEFPGNNNLSPGALLTGSGLNFKNSPWQFVDLARHPLHGPGWCLADTACGKTCFGDLDVSSGSCGKEGRTFKVLPECVYVPLNDHLLEKLNQTLNSSQCVTCCLVAGSEGEVRSIIGTMVQEWCRVTFLLSCVVYSS